MSDKFQAGIKAGSTDVSVPLELRSSTDSTALTAKTHSDVTAYYWRQGGSATSVTATSLANEASAHTDGGFVEVDATNMPGLYRFDLPDAAVATGADWVVIGIKVTGAFQQNFMFNLTTNVIQTGDSYARLGAPAGASVSADIATVDTNVDSVLADTNELQTDITDGGRIDLLIDAILEDTGTTIPARFTGVEGATFDTATDSLEAIRNQGDAAWTTATGFSTLDAAGVRSAVGLAAANLDTQMSGLATGAALTTVEGKVDTIDGIVDAILVDTGTDIPARFDGIEGATFDTATDSLEALRDQGDSAWVTGSGGDATAANQSTIITHLTDIKGATWSSATDTLEGIRDRGDSAWVTATGFSTLDAAGVRTAVGLAAANLDTQLSGLATDAALTTVEGKVDTIDAVVDAILVDTNELQTDWTDGGRLDNLLDGASAPDAATVASAVRAELTTELGRIDVAVSSRAAALSGGSGGNAITVTVTDGTAPLENAVVQVTEGVTTYRRVTDVNGTASFNLDAATYSVAVSKAGYDFTTTTRTVTGAEAGTLTDALEMTAIVIPAEPSDGLTCRVYGYVETADNRVAASVSISFTLVDPDKGPVRSTKLVDLTKITVTTDANGQIEDSAGNKYLDLQRNDSLTPSGTFYWVDCEALNLRRKKITLNGSTYDISSIVE